MAEKKTKKPAKKKDAAGEMVFVRMPTPLLLAIDQYRDLSGMQTTGEAIRQIVRDELVRRGMFKMPESGK